MVMVAVADVGLKTWNVFTAMPSPKVAIVGVLIGPGSQCVYAPLKLMVSVWPVIPE